MDLAAQKFMEGQKYWRAFARDRQVCDLDKAIELQREVNFLTPTDHPQFAPYQSQLSGFLAFRAGQVENFSGSMDIIMESVQTARAAVRVTPPGSPKRATYLGRLSVRLRHRYIAMEALQDLQEAVKVAEEARDCASVCPERNQALSTLRCALSSRFQRLGDPTDIDQAVGIGKAIIASDPENPDHLSDASMDLRVRFDGLGNMYDLNEAIKLLRDALRITAVPKTLNDKYGRPWLLANTSGVLKLRFDKLGRLCDLDEAVTMSKEALQLFPSGHSDRAHRYNHLGKFLRSRYDLTRSLQDLTESTMYFEKAAESSNTSFLVSAQAWKAAAGNHVERHEWKKAAQSLSRALEILPRLTPRSISPSDQLQMLKAAPDIGSLASSVFLKVNESPFNALNALETGQGVTNSLAIDSRKDLSQLMTLNPKLGSRYQTLRSTVTQQIPNSEDSQTSVEDALARRVLDIRDLDALEEEIRQISGLDLLDKRLKSGDILEQARYGALVSFNVNTVSSQAFVVTSSGIQVVPLKGLTVDAVTKNIALWNSQLDSNARHMNVVSEDRNKTDACALRDSLRWLWDEAVKPVLEASQLLGEVDQTSHRLPRIWWIGGGLLALAPLHAAGYHDEGSTDNTLSHVVSSYSSTLRTLQYARAKAWKPLEPQDKLLSVVAPPVPGYRLLDVEKEVEAIRQHVGPKLTICSQHFTSRADILQALSECAIAHFSCHGELDTKDPASSGLVLGARFRLTIADLNGENFHPAWLAYLSACSTAESNTKGPIAESIHLANAFQLVGFCHVVGTLWEAYDQPAIYVAAKFYEVLLNGDVDTHKKVAYALHNAILSCKDRKSWEAEVSAELSFKWWAPFIHVGP